MTNTCFTDVLFVRRSVATVWVAIAAMMGAKTANCAAPVDYNREIRPILSDKCLFCHGFDERQRQAELRLDQPDSAFKLRDGQAAIVPFQPDASQLIRRIESNDPDEVMPPPKSHRSLSTNDKALLRRWIAEGAVYSKHWSFEKPKRRDVPADQLPNDPPLQSWKQHAIDRLILRSLLDRGLQPMPRATQEKWLRRVSLDLTGLAPSPEQVDAFIESVRSRGEPAYAAAVDELLTSPRFGERMAQEWMDAARYADTHGFNNDSARSMWRWRDWVIDAFNKNLPYDQFITKQLAGDLLTNPSLDDLIATGYGRNHVINSEGGIIEEEYRVEYVVDRVRTLGTSILGLTLECSRCHDHKFDPITQREFYQLFAFFNQVDEVGEDGRERNAFPMILAPTKEQQTQETELRNRIAELQTALETKRKANFPRSDDFHSANVATANVAGVVAAGANAPIANGASANTETKAADSVAPVSTKLHFRGNVVVEQTPLGWSYSAENAQANIEYELPREAMNAAQPWTFSTWLRWDGHAAVLLSSQSLELDASSSSYGKGLAIEVDNDGRIEVKLGVRWPAYSVHVRSLEKLEPKEWTHVWVGFEGKGLAANVNVGFNGQISLTETLIDGMNARDAVNHPHRPRLGSSYAAGAETNLTSFAQPEWYSKFVPLVQLRPAVDRARLSALSNSQDRSESARLAEIDLHLRSERSSFFDREYRQLSEGLEQAKLGILKLQRETPTAMVMRERPGLRKTHVLFRGQYNSPKDEVQPDVPAALGVAWPAVAPRNRLGLAQWLTLPDHPLTARVAVNRIWQQVFGTGLVKTSEDFGFQGEYPANRDLLDWLAVDFIESSWDVKRLLRQIVLSEAYRQDSRVTAERLALDPENRWLTRGPRMRLSAELLRDHILECGGLLKQRLGGPSVYPSQPEDLYKGIVVDAPYDGTKWGKSEGDDLYRRSLYTFWKRTVPYPVLTVFDAPDREFCVARRSVTNTPLQALTLMNEPGMIMAARGLAHRAHTKTISPGARSQQSMLFDDAVDYAFRIATGRHPDDREKSALVAMYRRLVDDFRHTPDAASKWIDKDISTIDVAEHASLIAVCSVILNLDETITKD